ADLAGSAREGFDLLHRRGGYSIVLIDAQMPEINGFECARRIQPQSVSSGAVVMMLNSLDLHISAARCQELGVTAYAIKPISPGGLQSAILQALSFRAVECVAAPLEALATAISAGKDIRVLLAED